MEWQVIGLLMIAAVLFTVFLGVPIGFALVAVALTFMIPSLGFVKSTYTVATELWGFWTSWSLLPIVLFILMAEFLFMGGAAKNIFDMAAKWLQRLPGGLAVVTTAACAVFASMCGSSGGAAATMAVVAIPEMRKRGYSARLSGGCVAVSGCLAHLIPPSVLMVVYASLAEISPGRALIAGAIPGFLLAFLYILTTFVWVAISPSSATREMAVPFREKVRALRMIWQPAFIILAVMGSMLMGVATATEAAALGGVASLIIALINRRVKRRQLVEVLVETARMGCFILVVCVGGKTLSQAMTYYLIPQHFVEVIVAMNFSPIPSW